MNGTDPRTTAPLNPTQRATFDGLLAVGGERPYAPAGLVERLREHLEAGIAEPVRRWTEPSLWLSKGALFAVRGCEGAFVAERATEGVPAAVSLPVAVGTVTHRAIQMLHTHPGTPVEEVVRQAVEGSRSTDEKLAEFWETAGAAAQSDLLVQATSRTMGLIDSWPALHPSWSPRFEEPIQVKVGKLTLSGRVDLLLGRPRPDGKQTMVIADWKSGGLKDDHELEAAFYALLATLRFGVPPFRSTIYSLASGTWTDPDVTAERLFAAANWVIESVTALVDVLTESRTPELVPSGSCSWCPVRETCPVGPAAQKAAAAEGTLPSARPMPASAVVPAPREIPEAPPAVPVDLLVEPALEETAGAEDPIDTGEWDVSVPV